jgi:hypothetical protein
VLPVKRKNPLGDFILKTIVLTTPRHTTKRVTLSRKHDFLPSLRHNCSSLQRQAVFLKLATFENNFLNLASFSRGVRSGSDSFCRQSWELAQSRARIALVSFFFALKNLPLFSHSLTCKKGKHEWNSSARLSKCQTLCAVNNWYFNSLIKSLIF